MDLTSLFGVVAMAALLFAGVKSGQIPDYFLNWHAVIIVFGGTGAAIVLNTPWDELKRAIGQLARLWRAPDLDTNRAVRAIVDLSEQVRARGLTALREADKKAAGGYLARAASTAADYNNPDLVRQILEDEINAAYDQDGESINVYRTAGVLSPMFGLLGTLIGIVAVLKEISNPEAVGKAMSIAMTTAFYGIGLANIVCVPVAGKLRSRTVSELRVRGLVSEGIVMILKGTVPAVVERRLQAKR